MNIAFEIKCSNDFDCNELGGDCYYCLSSGICSKFEQNQFDCNKTESGCGFGDACIEGMCRPGYSCKANEVFIELHLNLLNCKGASRTGACIEGKK